MKPFRRIGQDVVHKGWAITVAVETFSDKDGETFERDIVHHPGAVAVLPVDGDEIVLIHQYRAAVDEMMWEIPAGLRDIPGEPLETTALRELQEETGLSTDDLEPLHSVHNSIGFSDELIHIFVAEGLRSVERTFTDSPEEQHLEIRRFSFEEALSMLHSGEITDGKTVVAILGYLAAKSIRA